MTISLQAYKNASHTDSGARNRQPVFTEQDYEFCSFLALARKQSPSVSVTLSKKKTGFWAIIVLMVIIWPKVAICGK